MAVNPFTSDFTSAFGAGTASGPTITFNIHVGLTGWVGPFSYVVGNRVVNSGNAYQCITAGTSASGAGPTTTGSNIVDGTVRWKWLSAVDFTSLASAQAALPTTFSQAIIWQIWNSAGTISIPGSTTPYLTLSGHTTTSANNLTITAAPGESFRDTVAGGHTALAFNASAGVSITTPTASPGFALGWIDITDKFVVIDGLQFRDPNATSGTTILSSEVGSSGLVLRNCLFDGTAQAGPIPLLSLSDSALLTNCVLIDRQPSTASSVAITANATCTIVNCTAYAGTAATNTVMLLSNSTTVGGSRIRNSASFGYPTGIGFTGGSGVAGNVIVDHCVCSSATIGAGCTDGGSNLLSQSAATNFIAPGTDLRLTLGASCVNAGVTDLVNIPLGTDIVGISRPQSTAWDVGAFELKPLAIRGTSMARGRAAIGNGTAARGNAKSSGRGILVASLGALASIGKAIARGAATGTFTQVSTAIDPWDAAFSSDFGPLNPPAQFSGTGTAQGRGRSLISASQNLTARGRGSSIGQTPATPLSTALTARSSGRDTGRTAMTASLPLVGRGRSKTFGAAGISGTVALAGRGQAAGRGRADPSRSGVFSAKGSSSGRGAGATGLPANLIAKGSAVATGSSLGVFRAGALSGGGISSGRSETSGRATLSPTAFLQTVGTASARGNSLFGSNVVILLGAGFSLGAARSQSPGQTSALTAQGNSSAFGRLAQGAVQTLTASGRGARAMARAAAIYNAFLPSRGRCYAKAQLTNPTLTAALAAAGVAQGDAVGVARYQVRLSTISHGTAAGRVGVTASRPLSATGFSAADGTLGGNGLQRLTTTQGNSLARGRGAVAAQTTLAGVGKGTARGAVGLLLVRPLALIGLAVVSGVSTIAASTWLRARSNSRGIGTIDGTFSVDLSGAAQAAGAGSGQPTQDARVTAVGLSAGSGGLAPLTGLASVSAVGRGVSAGQCGALVFAPIALVASGQARTIGRSRNSATTALRGTSLGLSSGRCASIQSALLLATGRSHGAGVLAAAFAVGLQARAKGEARGRLYSLNAISASGKAQGSGAARVSGYYNVTPDVVGPRLSSLGFQPSFDPMNVDDVDFVSWDWSARASVAGDPIITATVTASPPLLPVSSPVVVGDIVQVRIGAVSIPETFTLRCSVTLRSGRVLHWSAPISVEDF
jgi:hypothetical protein